MAIPRVLSISKIYVKWGSKLEILFFSTRSLQNKTLNELNKLIANAYVFNDNEYQLLLLTRRKQTRCMHESYRYDSISKKVPRSTETDDNIENIKY